MQGAPQALERMVIDGEPTPKAPHRRTLLKLFALTVAGLGAGSAGVTLSAGCTTVNAPLPPPAPCDVQIVTLRIYAADNINPNESNNPRPVVVKLYQLKDSIRLENARYDDILLREKETLADDILKVDEVIVYPNDLVEIKFERMKEATWLAGVALFFQPKGTSWKTFYAFPPAPGEAAQCGGGGAVGDAGDAGKSGVAEPQVAFFIDSAKIDNGSQFDESMFPSSTNIRRVSLPKGSANPEGVRGGAGGAVTPPGAPPVGLPTVPGAQAPGIPVPKPPVPALPPPPGPPAPPAPP
jgi:type VI secretion system protein VasD